VSPSLLTWYFVEHRKLDFGTFCISSCIIYKELALSIGEANLLFGLVLAYFSGGPIKFLGEL